ncbi:FecR family protein [Orrella sp. 11846]|uniref:FecR family protein n=1 Tax=Orrella sp. 11846 TaxID=3409913 RepID=UPI003B598D41
MNRTLQKSDQIYRKERIETGGYSRVQMRFTDGGLVSLMADSVFVVEDYFYKEGETETAVFGLLKSGLRTVSGAIGKVRHEDYQLKTPVATLGIRGTQYTAVLFPADTLRVHVGEGRVVLTNDHGTLDVPSGHNAEVTLESAPRLSEEAPVDLGLAPASLPSSSPLAESMDSEMALDTQNNYGDIVSTDGMVGQDFVTSVSDMEHCQVLTQRVRQVDQNQKMSILEVEVGLRMMIYLPALVVLNRPVVLV